MNMLEGVDTVSLLSYFISSIIGLCLVVYYYYNVFLPTPSSLSDDEDTRPFDTAKLDKEMEIFKKLAGENGGATGMMGNEIGELPQDYTKGVCEKYEWFQSDSEIEMFLPLTDHEVQAPLSKSDVIVVIQPKSLNVKIKGTTIIEDKFYDIVDPDECNWQFDRKIREDNSCETKLWITVFKNTPNTRKNYWKAVLDGDRKVMRTKDGKPLHMVDPNDKNSIKEAVKSLKRSMNEDGVTK